MTNRQYDDVYVQIGPLIMVSFFEWPVPSHHRKQVK